MATYVCNFCRNYGAMSYGRILTHLTEVHMFEPSFKITCHFCPQTYTKVSGYKSHLYRKHRHVMNSGIEQVGSNDVQEGSNDVQEGSNDVQEGMRSNEHERLDLNVDDQQDEVDGSADMEDISDEKRVAALFILKLKEVHMVTQDTVDELLEDITGFLHYHVKKRTGTSCPGFDPFAGLKTEYLQKKHFREHFGVLEPTERILGYQHHLPGPSGTHYSRPECCYDVPLLDSLQVLLNNRIVQEQVFTSHCSSGGLMRDYCDSEAYGSHPVFQEDACALQIQLYYDEIDVCNAIGSKSTVHKLGVFYYCLGNLDPALRSKLQSIMVLTVAKSSYVTQHGVNTILEPFVRDVKKLESPHGAQFDINGKMCRLRGVLTAVVADNPASCLLGGFKCLSSAFRKCRHCLATSDDLQSKFVAEDVQIRTKAAHRGHCASLLGAAASLTATTYGVNEDSVLNQLKYFHVTSGLPPDLMHDIFEGVATIELKCMLQDLIQVKRLFTLATLNKRIKFFPFGLPDIKSKPLPLPDHLFTSPNVALKQSSSQTWCLLRLLPLMIGDLIDPEDQNWRNFLILLRITDYACAPVVNRGVAGHLRLLIKEHHENFSQLYSRPLTPKFHYMLHMPQWIVQHGPLVRMWTMRYEGKHRYFKRWAHIMGNYKNISKTLANHHQGYLCYLMTSETFLVETVSVGRATLYDLETDPSSYKVLLQLVCHSLDDHPVFREAPRDDHYLF